MIIRVIEKANSIEVSYQGPRQDLYLTFYILCIFYESHQSVKKA